jgi:hypothetical protein
MLSSQYTPAPLRRDQDNPLVTLFPCVDAIPLGESERTPDCLVPRTPGQLWLTRELPDAETTAGIRPNHNVAGDRY